MLAWPAARWRPRTTFGRDRPQKLRLRWRHSQDAARPRWPHSPGWSYRMAPSLASDLRSSADRGPAQRIAPLRRGRRREPRRPPIWPGTRTQIASRMSCGVTCIMHVLVTGRNSNNGREGMMACAGPSWRVQSLSDTHQGRVLDASRSLHAPHAMYVHHYNSAIIVLHARVLP